MNRLLILKTGVTAPEVIRRHGDYDRWFTGALSHADIAWAVHDATNGPIPSTEGFTGVIVTGSAKAVYDHEPWMDSLAGFLNGSSEPRVPVLCVCFGMQFLAQAHGGRVILSPEGWEIGGTEVSLTREGQADPLFEGLPPRIKVLATHEDRIASLPAGAVTLASNEHSPVQALRCGEKIWGVQFHPEASTDLIRLLIGLRSDQLRQDAIKRGLSGEGHVERLLQTLRDPDIRQGAVVLDNFVRMCGG